ncbi:MAG: esterase/lipase family protein [Burkholderiales bacterium]
MLDSVSSKELAEETGRLEEPAVVLVHGLWMTGWVLALQKRRLTARGYRAYLFSYPTVTTTLKDNAERLAAFIASLPEPRIHLIGHSLGGLVILEAVKRSPDPRIAGVVLLGPPYADCQSARIFGRRRIGRWLLGKSLPQWVNSEKPAWSGDSPLGVIAGSRRFGLGMFFTRFEGINDGVVALEETKIPGMRAHLVLPVAHSEMIFSSAVIHAACRFFEEGRFEG